MPLYSLREYTAKIAAQIQDGQIEEAIAHTRHILSRHPRYLVAYSLLARASMEKGDLSHASHFFQTILSANPEDASAWMNLGQLSDDLGEVEQAVWYMERAFEIEPGNNRIRERLRQLYSQRDGVERARIKLTSAALARTQMRSGSFRRASQKLQRILKTESNLPPLQVATLEVSLARALWNQKSKASQADEVCASLLQKLPRCFQANLIRAQIYASAGQTQQAAPYLKIARELDPEGDFAFKLLGSQSPLPQTRVEIPYLDYRPAPPKPKAPVVQEAEDTRWLDEFGPGEKPHAQEERAQERKAAAELEQEPQKVADQTQPEASALKEPDTAADSELVVPAWLREIQQESTKDSDSEQDLDWLQEPLQDELDERSLETESEAQPEQELPDWLEGLRPVDEEESEPLTSSEQTMVSQVPDWLLDLGQGSETTEEELAAESLVESQEPEPEIPDWLQQLEQTDERAEIRAMDVEPIETPPKAAPTVEQKPSLADLDLSDDPDRPAWLQELQAEITGTPKREPVTRPLTPVPEQPPVSEPSDEEQEEQEPYEWLADLGVSELAKEEPDLEPTPEDELPDWLLELRDQTAAEKLPALESEPAEAEPALETEFELEPELTSILDESLELEEPEIEEELPEWLQSLEPEPDSEMDAEPAGDLEQAPEWLSEPAEEPVSKLSADEMPDWLGRLREAKAETGDKLERTEPEPATEVEDLEWLQELASVPEDVAPEVTPAQPAEQQEPEPERGAPVPALDIAPEGEPVFAQAPPEPRITRPLVQAPTPPSAETIEASVQQYETLLSHGDVKEEWVTELEQAVRAHPEHSGLQRVLGDAYMRSNRLGEALEAYREALRKL